MSGDKASSGGRQERLAAALRDNLRRRKAAHRPDGETARERPEQPADPAQEQPRPPAGR